MPVPGHIKGQVPTIQETQVDFFSSTSISGFCLNPGFRSEIESEMPEKRAALTGLVEGVKLEFPVISDGTDEVLR